MAEQKWADANLFRIWSLRPRPSYLGLLLLLAIVLYLMLPPIIGLALGSVATLKRLGGLTFSLDSLIDAYGQAEHYRSLLNSLVYSGITATIVLALGSALAWLIERTNSPLRHAIGLFALAPVLVPSVLFVTGWILLLGPKNGMINLMATKYLGLTAAPFNIFSFGGMVWVGILEDLPLAVVWLRPAFRSMNPELEEAALMLGGSATTVLRRIIIPILRPSILSAWVIFFVVSLGALMIPLLIGVPSRIFLYSAEIYLATRRIPMDLNLASAFCLVLLAASVVGTFAFQRATRETGRFVTITGRGFRPRITRLGVMKWPLTIACALLLLLAMGLPVFAFVWNAFLQFPQAPSIDSFRHMTLSNFGAALRYGPAISALGNSLLLGLLAGVITTALGSLIAWFTLRGMGPRWCLRVLDQLSMMPVAMPGLLVGVSLMWIYLFLPIPLYGTLWIILVAYVTLFLPYGVRICAAGLGQLHREIEEAGHMCGASSWAVFRRIVLSIIAPSLLGSVLYVGFRAFREYSASIFLVAPGTEVFSTIVLDMWDGGNFGILCAYVTMVVLLLGTLLLVWTTTCSRLGIMTYPEKGQT